MIAWTWASTSTLVVRVLPVLLVDVPPPVTRGGGGLTAGPGCTGGEAAAAGAGAGATGGGVAAGVAWVGLVLGK